jgi:RNA 3'-terminal phosphate cyclase (ATP)
VVEIEGSYGEGGGQVLRTSLTLSALTGQSVHLSRIRASRRNPGLAPQHLTAVHAMARVCAAEVRGAAIGSTEIEFHPQSKPRAGEYAIDVTEAAQGGSAGSVTLILQALLLPLALADAPSHLTLKGGTHVAWSPPFHYLAHAFLPTVARMGLRGEARLDAWGFYPVGGGQVSVDLTPPSSFSSLSLIERGPLKKIRGWAVVTNLPAHISQRIANRARNVLTHKGLPVEIAPLRERGAGPGAGLFLVAEYEHSLAGFSSLGEKGKPSDQVADEACHDLLAHHAANAPVDMHLADQLLLPMALASGRSEFRACRISQHLLTNAHVISCFLPSQIEIVGEGGGPGAVMVTGAGWGHGSTRTNVD